LAGKAICDNPNESPTMYIFLSIVEFKKYGAAGLGVHQFGYFCSDSGGATNENLFYIR